MSTYPGAGQENADPAADVPAWLARALADRAAVGAELRAWARGLYPLEAAVELLIRAHNGRLLHGPWIGRDGSGAWIDADAAGGASEFGYLSGGERRLLDIALSLSSERRRLSLSEVLPGLDRDVLDLVLAAVAHAGGSHTQSFLIDDMPGIVGQPGTLHAWPEAGESR